VKKQIALVSMGLFVLPLSAQAPQPWVGLQAGYDWQQEGSRNAKDNGVLGAALGTWCTTRWGGEASLLGTQLKARNGGGSTTELHGDVLALFNLAPDLGTWVPFLEAGLGATQLGAPFSLSSGTTVRPNLTGGVGVHAFTTDHLILGLEGRAERIYTHTAYTELLALVTVGYRWGGAPAPTTPAPASAPPPPAPAAEQPAPAPAPAPAPTPAPAPAAEPAPVPETAAAMPAPAPPPAPAPAPPPMKIVLDEAVLHFANGSATVPPEGVVAVQRVARSLKAYQGPFTLVVSGHTSAVGKPAYNKALSKRRADAVARILADAGIPAGSIQTVGTGSDNLIADDRTRAGQARNRRVEIEIKAAGAAVETRMTETGTED
jgi:OOP family OmpA-OmpF porin